MLGRSYVMYCGDAISKYVLQSALYFCSLLCDTSVEICM